jgi:hypothetical protein
MRSTERVFQQAVEEPATGIRVLEVPQIRRVALDSQK